MTSTLLRLIVLTMLGHSHPLVILREAKDLLLSLPRDASLALSVTCEETQLQHH